MPNEVIKRPNRHYTPVGCKEVPIFELNEKGEVVDSGKKHNLYDEIQSYKDSVAIDSVLQRMILSGESFSAPESAFGDATLLPKDPLEAMNLSKTANAFISGLSDDEKNLLYKDGFDALLTQKLAALSGKKDQGDTASQGGDKD